MAEILTDIVAGREGAIRSALRRRRAKNSWLSLVTTMRDVNIADCENLFIKDEYRHIVFDEDDLVAVINGEYVVKTPSLEEESQGTPSKRVTWRESLEETFYDPEEERDDCLVVDISPHISPHFSPHRSFLPPSLPRAGQSHSAPSSPVKSPQHRPGLRWPRSRSADRSWRAGEERPERPERPERGRSSSPGHSHVYGDKQNKVRRVRCNHTRQNEVSCTNI